MYVKSFFLEGHESAGKPLNSRGGHFMSMYQVRDTPAAHPAGCAVAVVSGYASPLEMTRICTPRRYGDFPHQSEPITGHRAGLSSGREASGGAEGRCIKKAKVMQSAPLKACGSQWVESLEDSQRASRQSKNHGAKKPRHCTEAEGSKTVEEGLQLFRRRCAAGGLS